MTFTMVIVEGQMSVETEPALDRDAFVVTASRDVYYALRCDECGALESRDSVQSHVHTRSDRLCGRQWAHAAHPWPPKEPLFDCRGVDDVITSL